MRIIVNVAHERPIARDLHAIADRVVDLAPGFERAADDLRDAERRWFASEGEGTWPPLAASTVRAKRRRGHLGGTLVATGDLRDSLTNKRDPMQIVRADDNDLLFGTRVPYARYQHGRGRSVIGISHYDRGVAVKTLQQWIMTGSLRP